MTRRRKSLPFLMCYLDNLWYCNKMLLLYRVFLEYFSITNNEQSFGFTWFELLSYYIRVFIYVIRISVSLLVGQTFCAMHLLDQMSYFYIVLVLSYMWSSWHSSIHFTVWVWDDQYQNVIIILIMLQKRFCNHDKNRLQLKVKYADVSETCIFNTEWLDSVVKICWCRYFTKQISQLFQFWKAKNNNITCQCTSF